MSHWSDGAGLLANLPLMIAITYMLSLMMREKLLVNRVQKQLLGALTVRIICTIVLCIINLETRKVH